MGRSITRTNRIAKVFEVIPDRNSVGVQTEMDRSRGEMLTDKLMQVFTN